jgi:hypothetical protein
MLNETRNTAFCHGGKRRRDRNEEHVAYTSRKEEPQRNGGLPLGYCDSWSLSTTKLMETLSRFDLGLYFNFKFVGGNMTDGFRSFRK